MKTGWKTSEFWVTIATAVGSIVSVSVGPDVGDATSAVIAAAGGVAVAGYALSRAISKNAASNVVVAREAIAANAAVAFDVDI